MKKPLRLQQCHYKQRSYNIYMSLIIKTLFTAAVLAVAMYTQAQPAAYTTANAHAHNDYEKPHPFYPAYESMFGSIEADIFLHNGKLIVAHDTNQVKLGRRLDSMYLFPLQEKILLHQGHIYTDSSRSLQFMIDLKTAVEPTLEALVDLLYTFPVLTGCKSLLITISGSRPETIQFPAYPAFIWFDGELHKTYTAEALSRVPMFSDNFKHYSGWNGTGVIPAADREKLEAAIAKAHHLHKKIRFWNAPDNTAAWQFFIQAGADYINTDQVKEIAAFLK